MAAYINSYGRAYGDKERRAMFNRMKNKFAIQAALAAGVAAGAAGAAKDIAVGTVKMPGKIVGGGLQTGMHIASETAQVGLQALSPGLQAGGALLGDVMAGIDELGGPPLPTNPELLANSYLDKNGKPMAVEDVTENVNGVPMIDPYAMFSQSKDIDVDKMRKLVQKQYPKADVDTDVKILPPEKYMNVALKDNLGREDEAIISNGFYNPVTDKTYLESGDKLNTTRALIHELAHDMAEEGVKEDYMINEGYADYVALKIMVEELNVPESVARKTLGYPEEVKKIEDLVKENGRFKVDQAFLKKHTLRGLNAS